MSNLSRVSFVGLFVLALVAGVTACGGGTNNDQGTSFTALGYFMGGDEEDGDVGTIVYVNEDVPLNGSIPLFVPVDKNPDEDGLQGGYLGVENHLKSQYIRVTRIDCDYDLQGADPSLSLPSDSFNVTSVVAAAGGDDDQGSGIETTGESKAFIQFFMVSPDVLSYLAVNQNLLPELPYRMTAMCRAVGVTQAGDLIVTNDAPYTILFAEMPEGLQIVGGFDTGPGTGGDVSSEPVSAEETGYIEQED